MMDVGSAGVVNSLNMNYNLYHESEQVSDFNLT